MKLSEIGLSLQKEMTEVLRDTRALCIMLGIPVLVCPLFGLMPAVVGEKISKQAESRVTKVILVPDNDVLRPFFQANKHINLVKPIAGLNAEQLVLSGKCDVIVYSPQDFAARLAASKPIQISILDSAFSPYLLDEQNVSNALDEFEEHEKQVRLAQYHIPQTELERVDFSLVTVETARQRSAYWTGFVCTLLLVLTMTMSSMYPALDVITGERERGTLVLLLMAPGERRNIVIAKLLTVTIITLIATTISLASICLSLLFFTPTTTDFAGSFRLSLPIVNLLLSSIFLLPLAVSISACSILISSYAKTFQQGQSYFVPLMFLGMVMTGMVLTFDESAPFFINFVPVANLLLGMHKAIQGQWNWLGIIATALSSALFIGLLLRISVSVMDREESLFGIKQAPTRRTSYTKEAFVLFGSCLAGFFYVSGMLQSLMPQWGVLVGQLLVFAAPSLLVPRLIGAPWKEILQLKRPRVLSVIGAVLVTPGMALLSSSIANAQQSIMPDSESYIKALQDAVIPHGHEAWIGYITIALGPAICEELLFRGAIQGFLRKSFSKPILFGIVAVLFGILHGSSARFLPTTIMGFILAAVAEYSGSIFPSMIMHACNNSLAVYQAQANIGDWSPYTVAGAITSSIIGIALLVYPSRPNKAHVADSN